ncbi:MAG: hypothetical protein K2K96_01580 [Lachnospiraceae bacterium]|nr:hypothetical protein [Lachnospiraceae bacterium]
MNKKKVIIFGVIGAIILLGVIWLVGFWKINLNLMRGEISVTINGEEYLLEKLACRYEDGSDEKVMFGKAFMDSGVTFTNSGSSYGMYEYTFWIHNEEINIEPKIQVFKANWYRICGINIDIDIYEDQEVWNADVSVETNVTTYQQTFYDIENNAIEMRVE